MGDNANLTVMGSTVSVDIGPVMVSGAVRARYARMVWQDGTLYVVHRRGGKLHRQVIAASEPERPDNPNGYWVALTDDGQKISATRKGCSG